MRRYIKDFAVLAARLPAEPSTNWSTDALKAFQTIKERLCTSVQLRWFEPGIPVELFTDASDLGVGLTIKQRGEVLSFASRKFKPTELNYTVREKEFLGIVYALEKYRKWLTSSSVVIHTDHQTLQYLLT